MIDSGKNLGGIQIDGLCVCVYICIFLCSLTSGEFWIGKYVNHGIQGWEVYWSWTHGWCILTKEINIFTYFLKDIRDMWRGLRNKFMPFR